MLHYLFVPGLKLNHVSKRGHRSAAWVNQTNYKYEYYNKYKWNGIVDYAADRKNYRFVANVVVDGYAMTFAKYDYWLTLQAQKV